MREDAICVGFHVDLPFFPLRSPGPHLDCVIRCGLLRRICVFARVPIRNSCTPEHGHNQFLPEIFDNVHHVRTDVPYDIEQMQNGQWAPSIDARTFPRVAGCSPCPIITLFSLYTSTRMVPRIRGFAIRTKFAEG